MVKTTVEYEVDAYAMDRTKPWKPQPYLDEAQDREDRSYRVKTFQKLE
jgi:hypothetical protein